MLNLVQQISLNLVMRLMYLDLMPFNKQGVHPAEGICDNSVLYCVRSSSQLGISAGQGCVSTKKSLIIQIFMKPLSMSYTVFLS